MRSSGYIFFVALCACASALNAQAQEKASQAAAATSAVTPPPKTEPIEDTLAPSITIPTPKTERKITQKTEQGKVTEVTVTTGGSTYILKPNATVGNAIPGDVQSTVNRGAQWKILEFNLGEKTPHNKDDNAGSGVKPSESALPPPVLIADPTVK
jgi:hypothetical protein